MDFFRRQRNHFFGTKRALLIAFFIAFSHSVTYAKDDLALAKKLSAQGKILPLTDILARAKRYKAGEVIEVEFEQKSRRYVYEIEVLDAKGMVWEIKLDAKTGELIKLELDD